MNIIEFFLVAHNVFERVVKAKLRLGRGQCIAAFAGVGLRPNETPKALIRKIRAKVYAVLQTFHDFQLGIQTVKNTVFFGVVNLGTWHDFGQRIGQKGIVGGGKY